MCVGLRGQLEGSGSQDPLKLPNIRGPELQKIKEYLEFHHRAASSEGITDSEVRTFDTNFVKVDRNLLFAIIIAANYLDISSLLDLTWFGYVGITLYFFLFSSTVASSLKGKTPDDIRKEYNIENDLTPEDEEEIKTESAWLYQ
jgi:S-phase kinase-associated protein 1